MICPYCGIGTSPKLSNSAFLGKDEQGRGFGTGTGNCTECDGLIVVGRLILNPGSEYAHVDHELLLYPPGPQARTVDPSVSGEYAQDFREASLVVDLSPKASAALSRRLLQRILHEQANIRDETSTLKSTRRSSKENCHRASRTTWMRFGPSATSRLIR
jgi:hypothetical protein